MEEHILHPIIFTMLSMMAKKYKILDWLSEL